MQILPACSPFLNFEFLRVLATAPYHGCDVAECFDVAAQLRSDDPEAWYRAWTAAAEAAEATARRVAATDAVAARWAWLRASNYRRASEFLLHHQPDDARLLPALEQSAAVFRAACPLLDDAAHVELLTIPYDGTTLPGYLFLPKTSAAVGTVGSTGDTPVLVVTGGFDATQEELYFSYAAGALPRGYAVVLFEGPGQGVVARRAVSSGGRRPLRPDWEVVIAAVLDELDRQAAAHPAWRLHRPAALAGPAMGAYFALRAASDAAVGRRLAACAAIDGFYDLRGMVEKHMPRAVAQLIASPPAWLGSWAPAAVDAVLRLAARFRFQARWELGHGRLATGLASPAAVLRSFLASYTLAGGRLAAVACPVLVTGARDSLYFSVDAGARRIHAELTASSRSPSKLTQLWVADSPGQGSLQAKIGALASLHEHLFGWLDQVFEIRRTGRGE